MSHHDVAELAPDGYFPGNKSIKVKILNDSVLDFKPSVGKIVDAIPYQYNTDSYYVNHKDWPRCQWISKEDIEVVSDDNAEALKKLAKKIESMPVEDLRATVKEADEKYDSLAISKNKYATLQKVLNMAYEQASSGKGKERHANDETFEAQQICQIPRYQGSVDFVTGQAIKKCFEINKLPTVEAKVRELLGAINYIAAAIIVLQEGK